MNVNPRQFTQEALFDAGAYNVMKSWKYVGPEWMDDSKRETYEPGKQLQDYIEPWDAEAGDYDDWVYRTPSGQTRMVGDHEFVEGERDFNFEHEVFTPSLMLPKAPMGDDRTNRDRWLNEHPASDWHAGAWKQAPVQETSFTTHEPSGAKVTQHQVGEEGVDYYYKQFEESGAPYIMDIEEKYDLDERDDFDDLGFGVDQFPRVIKADNVTRTLNGHHRIAAAAIHGYGSMPMRILDMDKRAEQGFQGSFWPIGSKNFDDPYDGEGEPDLDSEYTYDRRQWKYFR